MRRLTVLVVILTLFPSVAASATTLEELLERSRTAAYTAEQMISCSTPDGFRGVLARISQQGSSLSITSMTEAGNEIAIGPGVWARSGAGGVVQETTLGGEMIEFVSQYEVEEVGSRWFMGRDASGYRLIRDGVIRGEMVLDDETGAMVRMTSFDNKGSSYCDRRFITFEPVELEAPEFELPEGPTLVLEELAEMPAEVAGFTRVDSYIDNGGLTLTYYSDGFFSFAIFRTPSRVELPESLPVEFDGFRYERVFTAGQVSYAWEVRDQAMAMVGDLPPDLHQAVLEAMPRPVDFGFVQRLWRNLFGPR